MQLVEKRRKRIDKFIQKLKNDIDEVYEFLWRFWAIDRLCKFRAFTSIKSFHLDQAKEVLGKVIRFLETNARLIFAFSDDL